MKNMTYANFAVTMGAVSSGALLVLGPFFSVISDNQNWLPYYFLVYILTNIVANKYLTKVIDRKGGKYYLGWSFKLRVLLIAGTIPLVLANSGLAVVKFLSLGAALPDALFRSAYPTYVKKLYKSEEIQKINSNYSVFSIQASRICTRNGIIRITNYLLNNFSFMCISCFVNNITHSLK